MKLYSKLSTVGILSAALLATGAGAANATPQHQNQVEVYWLVPEGVPVVNNAVDQSGFPQQWLKDEIVPCGRVAQVDTYLESDAAQFTADSILYYGEDHGKAIRWRFVYGPECETPPTVVTSESPQFVDICTDEQGQSFTLLLPETVGVSYEAQIDDQLRRIRVVATATEGYVLASGEDKDVYHFEYTDETCPTEPPVTEPPTPPTEPEPPAPPSNELADTGLADDPFQFAAIVFVGLILVAGGVVLVTRRKKAAPTA